ncbi:unnamed protein product [Trifolium pratense]|uniref:Uncharacterized protein n=1 Tax=Trifolium pratense TaxID=57577 RepID=A0ACB0LT71_TRIPR|nr:unnamed protein product [Trifolium pratense]
MLKIIVEITSEVVSSINASKAEKNIISPITCERRQRRRNQQAVVGWHKGNYREMKRKLPCGKY